MPQQATGVFDPLLPADLRPAFVTRKIQHQIPRQARQIAEAGIRAAEIRDSPRFPGRRQVSQDRIRFRCGRVTTGRLQTGLWVTPRDPPLPPVAKGGRRRLALVVVTMIIAVSLPDAGLFQLPEDWFLEELVLQGEFLQPLERDGIMVPRAVRHARPGRGQVFVNLQ